MCIRDSRQVVQLQIGRGVDEALVDGIRMDVLLGHIAQVGAVDLRRHLHVARHARLGRDVVDPLGNLVEPAAVLDVYKRQEDAPEIWPVEKFARALRDHYDDFNDFMRRNIAEYEVLAGQLPEAFAHPLGQ